MEGVGGGAVELLRNQAEIGGTARFEHADHHAVFATHAPHDLPHRAELAELAGDVTVLEHPGQDPGGGVVVGEHVRGGAAHPGGPEPHPRRSPGRIGVEQIAGFQPGSFHAIYNATKAFVDSFSIALRNELKGTGVSLTCLMPGPTDTEFFDRADLMDTRMGEMHKADPAQVARIGFDAMLKGQADVVAGLSNKMQVVLSKVMPSQALAATHRKLAEPND